MMARSPPAEPGLEAPPPPQEPRSTAASAKKTLPMSDLRIESSFTLFPLFSPRRLNLQKLAAYRGLLKRNFQFAASRTCRKPSDGPGAGIAAEQQKTPIRGIYYGQRPVPEPGPVPVPVTGRVRTNPVPLLSVTKTVPVSKLAEPGVRLTSKTLLAAPTVAGVTVTLLLSDRMW